MLYAFDARQNDSHESIILVSGHPGGIVQERSESRTDNLDGGAISGASHRDGVVYDGFHIDSGKIGKIGRLPDVRTPTSRLIRGAIGEFARHPTPIVRPM
jgi:hypothetical protein